VFADRVSERLVVRPEFRLMLFGGVLGGYTPVRVIKYRAGQPPPAATG
jgi:hypothetical protein